MLLLVKKDLLERGGINSQIKDLLTRSLEDSVTDVSLKYFTAEKASGTMDFLSRICVLGFVLEMTASLGFSLS